MLYLRHFVIVLFPIHIKYPFNFYKNTFNVLIFMHMNHHTENIFFLLPTQNICILFFREVRYWRIFKTVLDKIREAPEFAIQTVRALLFVSGRDETELRECRQVVPHLPLYGLHVVPSSGATRIPPNSHLLTCKIRARPISNAIHTNFR